MALPDCRAPLATTAWSTPITARRPR